MTQTLEKTLDFVQAPPINKRQMANLRDALLRCNHRTDGSTRAESLAKVAAALRGELAACTSQDQRAEHTQILHQLMLFTLWVAEVHGISIRHSDVHAVRYSDGLMSLALRSDVSRLVATLTYYETGRCRGHPAALSSLSELLPQIFAALGACVCSCDWSSIVALRDMPASPRIAPATAQFNPVKLHSYCPFARNAVLWGGTEFDPTWELEPYVRNAVAYLEWFTRAAAREPLDGYVIAFPSDRFGRSMHALSDLLYRVLSTLSSADPSTEVPLHVQPKESDDWRFNFAGEDYFVPVFAPIYGADHPRFTHGAEDSVFLLFQPNASFHRRLAGSEKPKMRAEIRQKFKEGYQAYGQVPTIEAERFLPKVSERCPGANWFIRKEFVT